MQAAAGSPCSPFAVAPEAPVHTAQMEFLRQKHAYHRILGSTYNLSFPCLCLRKCPDSRRLRTQIPSDALPPLIL